MSADKQKVVVAKTVRLGFFGFFMVGWQKRSARRIHVRYERPGGTESQVSRTVERFMVSIISQ